MRYAAFWTVILIFAVYGAISFVLSFFAKRFCQKDESASLHTVCFLKNSACCAEYCIRAARRAALAQGAPLIAVDMGSEDETEEILRRMARAYDGVCAMNFDEYINFVKEQAKDGERA